MFSLKLITPPAVEPISLPEAKTYAKIQYTDEDALLMLFIKACRERAEAITNRALITQTWDQRADYDDVLRFNGAINVRKAPLQSVTSITYLDSNNTTQTWAPAKYIVDQSSDEGRIVPIDGEAWPSIYYAPNALTVRFVAGYGLAPDDVPATIRLWMLARLTTYDQFREQIADGRNVSLPRDYCDGLLDPYRVYL